MGQTLNTVEESIDRFIKDVPQALVNSGLEIDLEKLNIEGGQKIQDLACSYQKSFSDQINKGTRIICRLLMKIVIFNIVGKYGYLIFSILLGAEEKISALEEECENLRRKLQQQVDKNEKAAEEIESLRKQVTRELFNIKMREIFIRIRCNNKYVYSFHRY